MKIFKGQQNGSKVYYSHVPISIFSDNKETDIRDIELWELIRKLESLNRSSDFSLHEALHIVNEIHSHFENGERNLNSTNCLKHRKVECVSQLINLFGGAEVILDTLFNPKVRGPKSAKIKVVNDKQLKIRSYCIDLLHGISLSVTSVSNRLGQIDELMEYLFLMMEDKVTFMPSSVLLEDLLASNRKILDLKKIGNLQQLLSNLQDSSFPNFCRILSVLVADLDFSEEKSTLLAKDKEESIRSNEKSLADENQGLLLQNPRLLSRMVSLASRPLPNPIGSRQANRSMLQSLTSNLVLEEESRGNFSSAHTSGSIPFSEVQANDTSLATSGAEDYLDPYERLEGSTPLRIQVIEVMQKVEILYVLTLFLSGKFKSEVQSRLGDLKLIPALGDIFNKLGWKNECEKFPRHDQNDAEDCDCSPESALKIQFLRFVHSFCDHNEKKHLLLSNKEVIELKGLCEKYNLSRPPGLDKYKANSKIRCRGERGLLTKIVDVLKNTTPNNHLRFWLSRAIEGFLRGTACAPDQHFLVNRDLVKHLLVHILDKDTKAKEIIQSSFDLLGELMKFNPVAFQQFNDAITSDQQFEAFIAIMTSNVVDSNMFIRCIVLSLEKFSSNINELLNLDMEKCRLCCLIRKWEHKIYLIYKLIASISVDSLTQENVSCLNTTLIFFMFAYNHDLLSDYLQAFVLEEEAQKHPGLILGNLRELLIFWRRHYLGRGKDCTQLEQSSSILFEHWQLVVDVMLSDDISKETSLLRYISPKQRQNSRLRTLDSLPRDG